MLVQTGQINQFSSGIYAYGHIPYLVKKNINKIIYSVLSKYDCVKKFIKKYNDDGIIWYFDVAEMTNEDILRTMWQFKSVGWFIGCKGILFGRIEKEINYTGISLKEAINYNFKELSIPILINTDIGHTNPVFTIVNGAKVKISKSNKFDKYILETFFE